MFRGALALILAAPALSPAADLVTLDTKKHTGELVAASDKEVVFNVAGAPQKFAVADLQAIDFGGKIAYPDPKSKPIEVVLGDESKVRCSDITYKGKTVTLDLFAADAAGKPIKLELPLTAIQYVLKESTDLQLLQDFRDIYRGRGRRDILITKELNQIIDGKARDALAGKEGTFGDADAAGKSIGFTFAAGGGGAAKPVSLTRVHGLIVNQGESVVATAACNVIDASGDSFVAQAVELKGADLIVTTVNGVKVTLPLSAVNKLDYAAGAVRYLSDSDPNKAFEESTEGQVFKYRKNKNFNGDPIRFVAKDGVPKTYVKGLTVHSKSELTWDLNGTYKVFSAVVAADVDVQTPSAVKLRIDCDGKVEFDKYVRKTDEPVEIKFAVTNVQKLRITVVADGLDLGHEVSLAEAKVTR